MEHLCLLIYRLLINDYTKMAFFTESQNGDRIKLILWIICITITGHCSLIFPFYIHINLLLNALLRLSAAFSNGIWPLWLYKEWKSNEGCIRKVCCFSRLHTAVNAGLYMFIMICALIHISQYFRLLAKLEKADRAFCFTSGMAALAAVTRLVGTGTFIIL